METQAQYAAHRCLIIHCIYVYNAIRYTHTVAYTLHLSLRLQLLSYGFCPIIFALVLLCVQLSPESLAVCM